MFVGVVRQIKMASDWLDASLSFFSTSRRCSRNRSPSRLPVSPMYNLLHNVQVMQINDICGGTCETISDLNRSLRSRYLASVNNERQVLHRERAHLKVPGCSLVLSGF